MVKVRNNKGTTAQTILGMKRLFMMEAAEI
jgi:hypothetical protein